MSALVGTAEQMVFESVTMVCEQTVHDFTIYSNDFAYSLRLGQLFGGCIQERGYVISITSAVPPVVCRATLLP